MIFNIRLALKKGERVGLIATNAIEDLTTPDLHYNVNFEFLV